VHSVVCQPRVSLVACTCSCVGCTWHIGFVEIVQLGSTDIIIITTTTFTTFTTTQLRENGFIADAPRVGVKAPVFLRDAEGTVVALPSVLAPSTASVGREGGGVSKSSQGGHAAAVVVLDTTSSPAPVPGGSLEFADNALTLRDVAGHSVRIEVFDWVRVRVVVEPSPYHRSRLRFELVRKLPRKGALTQGQAQASKAAGQSEMRAAVAAASSTSSQLQPLGKVARNATGGDRAGGESEECERYAQSAESAYDVVERFKQLSLEP
jgi:hypothetical protein